MSQSGVTSGFRQRVRARTLRAPVFFGLIATPNGALRAPRPIAASLLFLCIPKIKIIYLTRAARVKGFYISFKSTTEAREYTECQAFYPVVRIGSPPSTARECCHFQMRGGGPIFPTMGHALWYSKYCAADFSLLNLPKGKSLGRSKPATNS